MKAQDIKFKNNDLNWLNEVTEYKLPMGILEDLLYYDDDHTISVSREQVNVFNIFFSRNLFTFSTQIIWAI